MIICGFYMHVSATRIVPFVDAKSVNNRSQQIVEQILKEAARVLKEHTYAPIPVYDFIPGCP